ncbi:MAG: LacI family DNA-binding transcriptional regulator [Propionibacteriaceae bacterium]|nr:LacI family DNA-binding transcriptional regulator [Propionibacteriaceae bacterium]
MDGRPPTQADVARLAGVSRPLVSLVVRNDPRVSPERRAAVEKAMADLGYRANAAARSLARSRSDLIGVVLPGFANHFYGELAEALRTAGEERNYVPLLASIAEDADREVSAIERFLELRVSGLILVSPLLDMDALARYGEVSPTVVLTRNRAPGTVDLVHSDDHANGRLVTEHLRSRGYDPIVYLGYERPAEGDSSRERRLGYAEAQETAGMPVRAFTAPRHGAVPEQVPGLEDLLASGVGIMCHNDRVAIAMASRLEALGLRPGADIGLAGFDNTALTHTLGVSLTSVDPDVAAMAHAAVELIDQRTSGRTEAAEVIVPSRLVERDSTRGIAPS